MNPLRSIVPFALALAVATCGGRAPDAYRAPRPEASTEVEVRNDRFEDLTIYLVMGGMYVRLGQVTGLTDAVLRIPEEHAGSLEWMTLVASHVDRQPHAVSYEFQIRPGERARWIVSPIPGPTAVVY